MGHAKAGSALAMVAGSLVGILTERDIMRAFADSDSADVARVAPVSAWMSAVPVTVEADATAGEALHLMLSNGFRHGVVSMRDLAQALSRGVSAVPPRVSDATRSPDRGGSGGDPRERYATRLPSSPPQGDPRSAEVSGPRYPARRARSLQ
jgi:CBS domain-containing protein